MNIKATLSFNDDLVECSTQDFKKWFLNDGLFASANIGKITEPTSLARVTMNDSQLRVMSEVDNITVRIWGAGTFEVLNTALTFIPEEERNLDNLAKMLSRIHSEFDVQYPEPDDLLQLSGDPSGYRYAVNIKGQQKKIFTLWRLIEITLGNAI